MSCLPGTPCYTSTIHTTGGTTGGCGLDPCVTLTLGSGAVKYVGPALSCSGINTCDTLTVALQKLDNAICTAPVNILATNGLTKTGNTIKLGGNLIQSTTIVTSFSNTLSIANLIDDTTPTYFVTQETSGVLRRSDFDDITDLILSNLTFTNGLTRTGDNTRLGGVLITPTTITTSGTNTLSITGLSTDNNPDFILTENTPGVVRRISLASLAGLIGTGTLADNGLTKVLNTIKLGGTLLQNTTVELDGHDLSLIDSTAPNKLSTITMSGNNLRGTFNYMSLGSNAIPSQRYSMSIGLNNNVLGGGFYGFAAGASNTLSAGSASYAIGATNFVANGGCGALGISNVNDGFSSHVVGYGLEIPNTNTGTFQVGIFNDVNAFDYDDYLGTSKYPSFSVGGGTQSGEDPAEPLNLFHVLKNGFVKSKDGYDSRSGERGILPPQWADIGWTDSTAVQTFTAGYKYIILQYGFGDDFSNLVDKELWGQPNKTGFTFIANSAMNPVTWTNGSNIAQVGRPTSPELGEMGFNLDSNCLEYWNGTFWCSLCCTTTTTTTVVIL